MTDSAVSAHVYVVGRVQGVFFRSSAADTARSLGLAGWVRNLRDGRVEALFEGDPDAIAAALEWCREGPPHAAVDHVEVTYGDLQGAVGFETR